LEQKRAIPFRQRQKAEILSGVSDFIRRELSLTIPATTARRLEKQLDVSRLFFRIDLVLWSKTRLTDLCQRGLRRFVFATQVLLEQLLKSGLQLRIELAYLAHAWPEQSR